MKHFKINRLGLLFSLLLLFIFLFLLGSLNAFADEPPKYDLSVKFDSALCDVYYQVGSDAEVQMTSETAYQIERGSQVNIRVDPAAGYGLLGEGGGLFDGASTQVMFNRNYGYTSYLISTFNEAASYEVKCNPRTFTVKFAPVEGAQSPIPTYNYPGGWPSPDLTYTYLSAEVTLNDPTLAGYEFSNWEVVDSEGVLLSSLSDGTIGAAQLYEDVIQTGIVYVRPKFDPNLYEITRYDAVYSSDTPNNILKYLCPDAGAYTWQEKMGLKVYGKDTVEGDTTGVYAGYEVYTSFQNLLTSHTVNIYNAGTDPIENRNLVYRFYKPVVYTVLYDLDNGAFASGVTAPNSHTYNAATNLPTPTRTGYSFAGWYVTVDGATLSTLISDGQIASEKAAYAAADQKICLKAKWVANQYTIDYTFNATEGGTLTGAPTTHEYDSETTVVPNPFRDGYTFLGWFVNGSSAVSAATQNGFSMPKDTKPNDGEEKIKLVASWQAIVYAIDLCGNGDELDPASGGTQSINATYDALIETLTSLPTRQGYTFVGFYTEGGTCYIDETGAGTAIWKETQISKLYAHWTVNRYTVTLSFDGDKVDAVSINGVAYTAPKAFDYRQKLTVKIECKVGYKLVKWDENAQTHTRIFEIETSLSVADDMTLKAELLPVTDTPNYLVNYPLETLTAQGGIPVGNYVITLDETVLNVTVGEDGKVTVNGVEQTAIPLPESFFGNTVSVVRLGGETKADTDPYFLAVSGSRPAKPNEGTELQEIVRTDESLFAKLVSNLAHTYEFALSVTSDETDLTWQDAPLFESLEPGTYYYLSIRAKAVENQHPHGVVTVFKTNTTFLDSVEGMTRTINALKTPQDGALVTSLYDGALQQVKRLYEAGPSASFGPDLRAIYQAVLDALPLASEKDTSNKKLTEKADLLRTSGHYNDTALLELEVLLAEGKNAVTSSADSDRVLEAEAECSARMDGVEISYLKAEETLTFTVVNMQCTEGMSSKTRFAVLRLQNIGSDVSNVNRALKNQNIAADGYFSDVEVLQKEMKTLDLLAVYGVNFTVDGVNVTEFCGVYTVTVSLPADLAKATGLRVAYYDQTSGKLTVLDSHRIDDALTFTADRLDDFFLLGDSVMDFTVPILALSLIALCQMIAIGLLISRRFKFYSNHVYSFALPLFALTVRLLPANGWLTTVLLAAVVILLQIVLCTLIFSMSVVHRNKVTVEEETDAEPVVDGVEETPDKPQSEKADEQELSKV